MNTTYSTVQFVPCIPQPRCGNEVQHASDSTKDRGGMEAGYPHALGLPSASMHSLLFTSESSLVRLILVQGKPIRSRHACRCEEEHGG